LHTFQDAVRSNCVIAVSPTAAHTILRVFKRCAVLAGGYLPVGGASSIAAAMIPIIEAAGGAVVTSAGVQEVLVRGGKASGVRLESGQEITSDVVSVRS
jgi:phytoene dehydrogenase-like protein